MTGTSDMARGAVFLDRDGVLNEVRIDGRTAASPRSIDEFHLLPGVAEAVGRLIRLQVPVVVVTNQPDLARGDLEPAQLEAMHDLLLRRVGVTAVEVCPHDGTHGCTCRKPAPGLLVRGAERLGTDLGASWMVGDRWVDIAAGRDAGVRTVLVDRPWSWASSSAGAPPEGLAPDHRVRDLCEAVDLILAERPANGTENDPVAPTGRYYRPDQRTD